MSREKLVNVELGPGRYVKMYESDAAKLRPAPEDKMRRPAEDKLITSDAFKGEQEPAADFTTIDGIGPATAEELREAGYRTFDDLRVADVDELPSRAQGPVRRWRNA